MVDPTFPLFDSYRPPDRDLLDPRLLRPSSSRALSRAFEVTAIPSCLTYPHDTDTTHHASRLLSGHLAVRSAYAMGRLDCASGYYPYHCIQRCNMCYASDARVKKGAQEADS